MSERHIWWANDPKERFWLEATDRPDIGNDLRAPYFDASGRPNWSYDLFLKASPGDVVFHYDAKDRAITSFSKIGSGHEPLTIEWAARGSYARERGAAPQGQPGYRVPLYDHTALPVPLTLAAIRAAQDRVVAAKSDLERNHGNPSYFPFVVQSGALRPLQGYSFKLPAAFVFAFDELARPLVQAEGAVPASEARGVILDIVKRVESVKSQYSVGALQEFRRISKGLQRTGKSLFSAASVKDEYAFHSGGRKELQLNIGFDTFEDGRPAIRSGFAFSFETSYYYPSIEYLLPKVRLFNEFISLRGDEVRDVRMWHFIKDGRIERRSRDRPVGPISMEIARPGAFVFLGTRQAPQSFDVHDCLRSLDYLYPLYQFVEARQGSPELSLLETPTIDFSGAVFSKPTRWITATVQERELDLYLRHNEMQERLRERLALVHGAEKVPMEVRAGSGRIDLVVRHPDGMWFYEVKTYGTARQCVREAIGQLLEYALWRGGDAPSRLVVVGPVALDEQTHHYLDRLNESFPIPIHYEHVELD
jgi:hypothetical protein